MYSNICNSFCCTPSFGVLQKICAQNKKYGQIHTIVEPITNQKQQHKFLTKTHTKNPVLPKKMDRQNSLSFSAVTGTDWCCGAFVLSGIWGYCLLRCWGGQALQCA